jgi:hypothetical protein
MSSAITAIRNAIQGAVAPKSPDAVGIGLGELEDILAAARSDDGEMNYRERMALTFELMGRLTPDAAEAFEPINLFPEIDLILSDEEFTTLYEDNGAPRPE